RTPTRAARKPQPSAEALILPQETPLPQRQVAELDLADAHALEAHHVQPNLFAHAADLALAALAQHEAQLVVVDPFDLGRPQRAVVQPQAVVEQVQTVLGQRAFDADEVFLVELRIRPDELAGNAAVLGQHQQAGGADVQAAGGREGSQLTGLGALQSVSATW